MKNSIRCAAIFLIAFLTACAATKPWTSPTQNYTYGKDELQISGKLLQNYDAVLGVGKNAELIVYINNTEAVRGFLSFKGTGELTGKYKDYAVTALCSSERKSKDWQAVSCPILINEKRTVTLTF